MLFGKKNNTPQRSPSLMAGQDNYTFRRSRTLTGSVSNQVNVTAQARSQLKTDRLKVQELKSRRKQLLKSFITVSVFCLVLTVLISSQIRSIEVGFSPNLQSKVNDAALDYKKTIKEYISGHLLEQFSFSINNIELNRYVTSKHPEIKSVLIDTSELGSNTIFRIDFREPILIWDTPKGRMFVDAKGVAFDKSFSLEDNLVKVVDKSGISPESTGATIASSRFVQFLGQLVEAVNRGDKGKVSALIIPASAREIDLQLEGRGYDIKTHIDRDPGQQAEDILNALAYIDQKGIKPVYIDVRVANKAFYR